jgi:hypothetical protein
MPTWATSLASAETQAKLDMANGYRNGVDVWIPSNNALGTWSGQRWQQLGNTLPSASIPLPGYWLDVVIRAVADQAARPTFTPGTADDAPSHWVTVDLPLPAVSVFEAWKGAVWNAQYPATPMPSAGYALLPEMLWSKLVIQEAVNRGVS